MVTGIGGRTALLILDGEQLWAVIPRGRQRHTAGRWHVQTFPAGTSLSERLEDVAAAFAQHPRCDRVRVAIADPAATHTQIEVPASVGPLPTDTIRREMRRRNPLLGADPWILVRRLPEDSSGRRNVACVGLSEALRFDRGALERATGAQIEEITSVEDAAARLVEEVGDETVLVKRSREGVLLIHTKEHSVRGTRRSFVRLSPEAVREELTFDDLVCVFSMDMPRYAELLRRGGEGGPTRVLIDFAGSEQAAELLVSLSGLTDLDVGLLQSEPGLRALQWQRTAASGLMRTGLPVMRDLRDLEDARSQRRKRRIAAAVAGAALVPLSLVGVSLLRTDPPLLLPEAPAESLQAAGRDEDPIPDGDPGSLRDRERSRGGAAEIIELCNLLGGDVDLQELGYDRDEGFDVLGSVTGLSDAGVAETYEALLGRLDTATGWSTEQLSCAIDGSTLSFRLTVGFGDSRRASGSSSGSTSPDPRALAATNRTLLERLDGLGVLDRKLSVDRDGRTILELRAPFGTTCESMFHLEKLDAVSLLRAKITRPDAGSTVQTRLVLDRTDTARGTPLNPR